MKKVILVLNLVLSLLYADDPCTAKNVTVEVFTKTYPHNVVIKKYHYEDGCGIQKDTIDILQNNIKINTLSGFYGAKLQSDDEIDENGNRKIILSAYPGGYGNSYHLFGVIEPNMKKLLMHSGFDIKLDDIDKDNNKKIIIPKSIFFCISGELYHPNLSRQLSQIPYYL